MNDPKVWDLASVRHLVGGADPRRRKIRRQWRRLDEAVCTRTVQDGIFQGMLLTGGATGSDIPKRLGSYEQELHPILEQTIPYDTVLDVGCGEGFYVVGLARLWPRADVHGFDISLDAQEQCRDMAEANGVKISVHGATSALDLGRFVSGRTLIVCDAEGAEAEVLDPELAPELAKADLLVELHEFMVPGVTGLIMSRFSEHQAVHICQERRDRSAYPLLNSLTDGDANRALDESRPESQEWLWLTRAPKSEDANTGS